MASASSGASRKIVKKPVSRGRPSGTRTRLQETQKETSKQKILDAACELFREKSYAATTIDDITVGAGISRVTFYKYFESKIDVAKSINIQSTIDFSRDFALLAKTPNPSEGEILSWMRHILHVFSASRARVQMLAAMSWQEPELIKSRADSYGSIIKNWGETIPAFKFAASGTNQAAKVRAHLLVVQLNELCYELAIGGWDVDHDTALGVVAQQYKEFIESAL
jgi:AcrR family transcriptional regulator